MNTVIPSRTTMALNILKTMVLISATALLGGAIGCVLGVLLGKLIPVFEGFTSPVFGFFGIPIGGNIAAFKMFRNRLTTIRYEQVAEKVFAIYLIILTLSFQFIVLGLDLSYINFVSYPWDLVLSVILPVMLLPALGATFIEVSLLIAAKLRK